MKPYYADEAVCNYGLLDFEPLSPLDVFHNAMLAIKSESFLRRDITLETTDILHTITLMKDLSDLGYGVEQTSPYSLWVIWGKTA